MHPFDSEAYARGAKIAERWITGIVLRLPKPGSGPGSGGGGGSGGGVAPPPPGPGPRPDHAGGGGGKSGDRKAQRWMDAERFFLTALF